MTPTFDGKGTIIGYHSNRRCPERDAVAAIAPLYEALLREEQRAGGGREGIEEIGEQVEGIQRATGQVVGASQGITGSIVQINEASMVVAASVKEQQVAAAGIRASSDAAAQVSSNVGAVASSAKLTEESAVQLLAAANELARLAETLRSDVDTFLHGVRGS